MALISVDCIIFSSFSDPRPSGSHGRAGEHVRLFQLVLRGHRPRPRKHERRLGGQLLPILI